MTIHPSNSNRVCVSAKNQAHSKKKNTESLFDHQEKQDGLGGNNPNSDVFAVQKLRVERIDMFSF